MRIDHPHFPSDSLRAGAETNDPPSRIVGAHAARAFDKQAVERAIKALHEPPNLLAIGDKDPAEVLRQEREAYEHELAYEAALHAGLTRYHQQHLGAVATVHELAFQPSETPSAPHTYLAS